MTKDEMLDGITDSIGLSLSKLQKIVNHQSLAQLATPSPLTLSSLGFTVLFPGFPSPFLAAPSVSFVGSCSIFYPELQVVCQVGCLRGQWGKQVWVGDWVEDVSLNIHPKSKEEEDIQFL